MGEVTRINVKQVLRRSSQIDHYFGNRYSFSPYRACAHACIYCDGRAEKYYVEGDFGSSIVIRENLHHRLEKELPMLREKGFIMAGSGVTDAYQPVEEKEKLMTRAAELVLKRGFPAIVITKSALVQRDLSYWKEVSRKSGFILLMTICTMSDCEREIFEPGASTISERLKTLDMFREAGITTGVTAMPLLPFLWDRQEKLEELFTALKDRIDYILPASLTLRPGIQKKTFMDLIESRYPDLLPEYAKIYAENRQSGAPTYSFQKELYGRIFDLLLQMEIPFQMPHRFFREKVSLADELHILIRHLEELYRPRGIDTRPVREAEKHYRNWLTPVRKEFNRRRSLPPEWIDEKLKNTARQKKIGDLVRNPKLGSFLEEVILEDAEFDYISLKLTESKPRRREGLLDI